MSKESRQQAKQERQAVKEQRREENRQRWQERRDRRDATIWFSNLGVAVYEGNVYQHGRNQGDSNSDMVAKSERQFSSSNLKLLGPLHGAHAEVGGGKAGRRRSGNARVADTTLATAALGPFGLLAGMSRTGFQGFAVVTFADGSALEKAFTDSARLIRAQAEAVQFNALVPGDEPQAADGITGELERLTALHDSGALDDEEFRTAKARLLGS